MDGAKLLAMQDTPEIMAARKAGEQEAAQRGVFGTPTWIYQDILYWGQERLDFLDEVLSVLCITAYLSPQSASPLLRDHAA